jgi:hypothetical protein
LGWIRDFFRWGMRRLLRLARRLHFGARRRRRCRRGLRLWRERVRYVPSVQCPPSPPMRLPRPVGGQALGPVGVGAVGPPMRLASALGRARGAARAHRRAWPAEHMHPPAPATPPKSTVHAPLLVGAAGRVLPTAARLHAAERLHAPAAKARGSRPGPSPSPARRATSSPPVRVTTTTSGNEVHISPRARGRAAVRPATAASPAQRLPQALHRRPQVFSLPPRPPSDHLHPSELLTPPDPPLRRRREDLLQRILGDRRRRCRRAQ